MNALAFTAAGQFRLAYALAREVRKTAEEETANNASKLMDILRGERLGDVPPLLDKWKVSAAQVLSHVALLLAVPVGLIFLVQSSQSSGSNTTSYLATTAPSETGGVPDFATANNEPAAPTCSTVPENEEILIDNANWTQRANKLEIQNGSGGDAIIKVRDSETGKLLVSFLAKKNMTATYGLVPDGTYRIQYAFGEQLDESCKAFMRLSGAGEFPGENTFTTTEDALSIKRTRLSFTLYSVPDGNVKPASINAEQFNSE